MSSASCGLDRSQMDSDKSSIISATKYGDEINKWNRSSGSGSQFSTRRYLLPSKSDSIGKRWARFELVKVKTRIVAEEEVRQMIKIIWLSSQSRQKKYLIRLTSFSVSWMHSWWYQLSHLSHATIFRSSMSPQVAPKFIVCAKMTRSGGMREIVSQGKFPNWILPPPNAPPSHRSELCSSRSVDWH